MQNVDLTYIRRIQSHLRNFKQESHKLFNFSCWYCGDSKKNPKKARGYLYLKDTSFLYHCHNCGKSTNLKTFLKDLDYGLYKEYLKDTLSDSDVKISRDLNKPVIKELKDDIFSPLERIDTLSKKHRAVEYLTSRRIPKKWWNQLYYTPEFNEFTNSILPDKMRNNKNKPRIIIPFYSTNKSIIGYQGRALYDSRVKYITIILNDNEPKFWGLDKVNFNKKFYITEGPFDSMFLENSIAVCGSEISQGLAQLNIEKSNAVIVYDNDPRNKQIVKQYLRSIRNGYSIFIWPDDIEEKDINDCILKGYTASEMQNIIDQRTFKGMRAELELNEWKIV